MGFLSISFGHLGDFSGGHSGGPNPSTIPGLGTWGTSPLDTLTVRAVLSLTTGIAPEPDRSMWDMRLPPEKQRFWLFCGHLRGHHQGWAKTHGVWERRCLRWVWAQNGRTREDGSLIVGIGWVIRFRIWGNTPPQTRFSGTCRLWMRERGCILHERVVVMMVLSWILGETVCDLVESMVWMAGLARGTPWGILACHQSDPRACIHVSKHSCPLSHASRPCPAAICIEIHTVHPQSDQKPPDLDHEVPQYAKISIQTKSFCILPNFFNLRFLVNCPPTVKSPFPTIWDRGETREQVTVLDLSKVCERQ